MIRTSFATLEQAFGSSLLPLEIMALLATEKPGEVDVGGVVVIDISSEDVTYIDPKEERAFVWRLDCIFLLVGFLGYTFKYIDQSNIVSSLCLTTFIR